MCPWLILASSPPCRWTVRGAILISLLLVTNLSVRLRSTCIGGASTSVLLPLVVWKPASRPVCRVPIARLPLPVRTLMTRFLQTLRFGLTSRCLCLRTVNRVQVGEGLALPETSMLPGCGVTVFLTDGLQRLKMRNRRLALVATAWNLARKLTSLCVGTRHLRCMWFPLLGLTPWSRLWCLLRCRTMLFRHRLLRL